LGFLIVGHTHEDIDGSFGYLSMKLKEQNNCHGKFDENIHVSQDRLFIPQPIQEIPDFKSWVNGYLNNGPNVLVGHTKIHLFQFFCG
jgi:hypothetical protein